MIARLYVLIPFAITIPDGEKFSIYELMADGYKVRICPPKRSRDQKQIDSPDEVLINGVQGFQADVLQIDFHRDKFERSISGTLDPPELLIKEIIDLFLLKMRFVTRASRIRPIDFPHVTWRLDYLNDDESELEQKEGLLRNRFGKRISWTWTALNKEIWDAIHQLPAGFRPPEWDGLLLDAYEALPEVGTAIVLSFTALEVFISYILEMLAKRSIIPPNLWSWINERDWLKQPSIEERFDDLLKILSGKSLKEDSKLWDAFKNLKTARNSFVHEGVAKIGSNRVSADGAGKLTKQTEEIVNFIKKSLPEDLRWPEYHFQLRVESSKKIFGD